jgi:uncharacterized protein (DUF302 family)
MPGLSDISRRHLIKHLIASRWYRNLFPIKNILSMDPGGITIRKSPYSVKDTIDRLVIFLEGHKATIYARINQQSEVRSAGKEIPALEFILFGNPRAGGPIMAENPIAALDLPLKIIAWEDAAKSVWLAYNKASYLEERYALPHYLMQPLDLDPLVAGVLSSGKL